ncbi:hypothetical protein PQR70_36690 [Paraburkholderia madseniana]|uniref:hypothetical protein n=1 Tax=Paraburkholderia madseniana TaxID=2599607 RepID=UPI0038B9532A
MKSSNSRKRSRALDFPQSSARADSHRRIVPSGRLTMDVATADLFLLVGVMPDSRPHRPKVVVFVDAFTGLIFGFNVELAGE